jgi:hypothetical protein
MSNLIPFEVGDDVQITGTSVYELNNKMAVVKHVRCDGAVDIVIGDLTITLPEDKVRRVTDEDTLRALMAAFEEKFDEYDRDGRRTFSLADKFEAKNEIYEFALRSIMKALNMGDMINLARRALEIS